MRGVVGTTLTTMTIRAATAPESFGDLGADDTPIRFPSSELLCGDHVVENVDLQASAMEVLGVEMEKREEGQGAAGEEEQRRGD